MPQIHSKTRKNVLAAGAKHWRIQGANPAMAPPIAEKGGLAPLGKKFFVVTKFGLPSVLVLALPWTEKTIFVYQV